ncbi:response regulator transcription factor [Shewanella salipaludis]|uniref:Response regulator transcription factor n=1 Tax=Shewanella salipaludis TaxID=2723052 RepID=A0A972G1Q1_9GAMM|nr:response regulator transcription factor [Shewanella salipaludis]NMH65911.1 response regulator transcription factor [Shewanella salipaludis]
MIKIDELVFIHQISAPCHLAILAESVGLKTRVVSQISELSVDKDDHSFCLVPQRGMALDNKGIPLVASRLIAQFPVALYQVDQDRLEAEAALLLGIKGLLFADQGMDSLLTGLKKMLAGELWYDSSLISRVFSQLIKRFDGDKEGVQDTAVMLQMLTSRERTVINLVSSGARNKEIAHSLCISEHTVKAHISSIFRKTQSRNRVELLRWAQTYQSHFRLCS